MRGGSSAAEEVRLRRAGEAGFGLYVHWPFCLAKCPYCDFNSHVAPAVDHDRWRRALLAELDHFAQIAPERRLHSIFFGGGTPSLMAPATAAALIERAARRFDPAPDLEITLEANPTSVEAGRLAEFRAAGINRVSLGVQALNDGDLRVLGREHGAAEALAAVDLAGGLFPRVSFDLIYARPGQDARAWASELERALAHAAGHLSLYQLTIEPGTPFHALHRRGLLQVPGEDVQAQLYEVTQERLEAAGMPAYEVSNHARPGEAGRHNLVYWRSGEWIGVGPGAHGRLELGGQRVGTATERAPRAWLERVERQGHAERPRERLSGEERLLELLLMGLRLIEGVAVARIEAASGLPLHQTLGGEALERLQGAKLIELTPDRLVVTTSGRQRLDAVIARLVRDLRVAAPVAAPIAP
jgi:putative oxygen-independent coproporphyrinogen III oxidase